MSNDQGCLVARVQDQEAQTGERCFSDVHVYVREPGHKACTQAFEHIVGARVIGHVQIVCGSNGRQAAGDDLTALFPAGERVVDAATCGEELEQMDCDSVLGSGGDTVSHFSGQCHPGKLLVKGERA
ncbi:MAG: hypothetical protein ACRDTA_29170 [Pseudonocardiaceae bacterium]